MSDLLKYLTTIHDILINNEDVADIFNVDDDKNSDNSFHENAVFPLIDWEKCYSCLKSTVNYLIEYAYKNDDIDKSETELNEAIYDLHLLLENSKSSNIANHLAKEDRLLLLKTHVLLLMFSITATITKDISKLIDQNLSLLYKPTDNTFYRGHSDEKYKLIPTICRSYDTSKYGKEMTYSALYGLYRQANLINKYANVFGLNSIDEEFCSFMQHSCSYSPFLDLTKKHIVALSFATNNYGNINDYYQKKSAVLEFSFSDNIYTSTPSMSKIDIYFMKNRFKYFSTFKGQYLFYCVPSAFDPIIYLLTRQTNDRMKYQDGAFLYFQSCVVVNGHILMPYRIGKITKYTISPSKKYLLNKSDIYQKIVSEYRQYDFEHLMDPYLYFLEMAS